MQVESKKMEKDIMKTLIVRKQESIYISLYATSISGKVYFRANKMTRDREGHDNKRVNL